MDQETKRRRAKAYSEAEIRSVMLANASGARVQDICRNLGITQSRFYTWRARYRSVGVSAYRRALMSPPAP